jgi:hypothetical protein
MCDCVIEWGQSSDRRAAQTERELRPERHGGLLYIMVHARLVAGPRARRGGGGGGATVLILSKCSLCLFFGIALHESTTPRAPLHLQNAKTCGMPC